MEANEGQRRWWNNERWAEMWPKRERLTDAVTAFLLDAASLQPGERVLDVGSGGGMASLAAAQKVGSDGRVVGVDISAPLTRLAHSRAQDAGAQNATFYVADLQTDEVDGRPFDVALSQFGVMFFEDPVIAFGNIRAHLKPGGRITFACWQSSDKNPWFVSSALAPFLPPSPTPEPGKSPIGPFALADSSGTDEILCSAGFIDVRFSTYEITIDAPPDSVVDEDQLLFMGVPDNELAIAQTAVDEHMQQFVLSPELSRFPLAFQVFRATNP